MTDPGQPTQSHRRVRRLVLVLAGLGIPVGIVIAVAGCELRIVGTYTPVDNSRCFVCHKQYDVEPFAVSHARFGVSCEDCHGMSDAHANDEEHLTPPDEMYGKDTLVPACMECHKDAKRLAKDETACPRYHEEAIISKQICTNCHGRHRLTKRIVRWDKDTGELIPVKKKE